MRRRSLTALVLASLVLPGVALTGAPGAHADDLDPSVDVSSLRCVVPEDAAALPTVRGRTIATLHPYDGRVYYGYGDYGANTGSMRAPYGTNVSSFDPGAATTQVHLHGFKTEEVNTFRTYDERLYVPTIDPSRGAGAGTSFASDRTGYWREGRGAEDPVHVYDVARIGEELFMVGSASYVGPDRRPGQSAASATVWRSPDGGRSWETSLSVTVDDPARRNGYERFYWAGVVDGKLFVRPKLNTPRLPEIRMYDPATGAWSTPKIAGPSGFGSSVVDAHDVVTWRDRLWSVNGLDLLSFDGTTVARVPRPFGVYFRHLAVGDDDLLYAMNYDGRVYRIDAPAEPEPEPSTEPDTDTEPETGPDSGPDTGQEREPQPQPEPQPEPRPEPGTDPDPEPVPDTEMDPEPEPESQADPRTDPRTDDRDARTRQARRQVRTLVRRIGRTLRAGVPAKAQQRRIRVALRRHGRGHGNGLAVLRRTAREAGTTVPALARQQRVRLRQLRRAVRQVRVRRAVDRRRTAGVARVGGAALPAARAGTPGAGAPGTPGAEAYTVVHVATTEANAASFTVARDRVWAAGPAGVARICSYRLEAR